MLKLKFNPGIGEMVFLTRLFLCTLITFLSLTQGLAGWLIVVLSIVNVSFLSFFRRKKGWWRNYFLQQYFLDALFATWAVFFFDSEIFLTFFCLFIIFSRYQGGRFFGKVFMCYFFLVYFLSFLYMNTQTYTLLLFSSVLLVAAMMVFSFYLGSLLCNIALEKNILIEELEIRVKDKDRLLSTLAHELRTPLTMIISASDILLGEVKSSINKTQFNFLNNINSNALRLVAIVEDILAQIKSEKSLLKIALTETDIRNVVKDVVVNMKAILAKKEQYIRCSYPRLLTSVLADEKWLHQALVNLVHNASKYIDNGSCILINVKENEQYLVISVVDDGSGIEDVNKMKIFSDSQENDDYRSYEGGAGIGLSIVKHIVEQHKGKLYVGTVPGLGTTLSFTLPKRVK